MGFGAVVFYACCLTVIQLGVPDHLRGRIMGIWMIVYSGSVPLGALWTGRAAVSWGVASVMAFSAVVCVVVGGLVLVSGILKPQYPREPAIGRARTAVVAQVAPQCADGFAIGRADSPGLTAFDTRTTASMIDSSTCSDHGDGWP